MKLNNPIFNLFIGLIFFVIGCDSTGVQQKIDIDKKSKVPLVQPEPKKAYVNMDSLMISIPGKDGLEKPVKIISDIPMSIDLISIGEIVPGVSYLHQKLEDKMAGNLLVMSKKPEIIKVNHAKLKRTFLSAENSPEVTILPKELIVKNASLSYYDSIVDEQVLISVQHEDTIYPPLSFHVGVPKSTKALPFRYKDEAIFDFSTLDSEQGLPSHFIRKIMKDKNDVMWFASFGGGLISYNGNSFEEYKMNLDSKNDMLMSALIDSKGNIWVGSTEGVKCFDGEKVTIYNRNQGLLSNIILYMIEDREQNIWFATARGISKYDGKTITNYTTAQGLSMNYVYTLFEDIDGNIWFGTFGSGAIKFDGESFTTYTQKDGLVNDVILTITQDNDQNIWFGTNGGGVSKYNKETFTNYSLEQGLGGDVILSSFVDADNNIWFGSYGEGITVFNGEYFSYYTESEGLIDNYIRTFFNDDYGNIWISTDLGLSKFKFNSFKHLTKTHGLPQNNITTVFQDNKGLIWFGVYEHGVFVLDKNQKKKQERSFINITKENGLADNVVVSIIQDKNNDLWFATEGGGVSKLDSDSFENGKLEFTNYSENQGLPINRIYGLLEDNNGIIWLSSQDGVLKFDGISFVKIENKLIDNIVICVYQDRSDAIWFGTQKNGIVRYYDDTLISYTKKQGLGNNKVTSIIQDNNGVMWFGTDGGGLSYFNGYSIRTFNYDDGICSDKVFSLTKDANNSIWIGTIEGLCYIELPDFTKLVDNKIVYDKPKIINYGKQDGLKGLDFCIGPGSIDNDNILWMGNNKGLTTLDLKKFKIYEEVPNINLNWILINNERIDFNKIQNDNELDYPEIHFSDISSFFNYPIGLSLPHNKNHLTFNFSAIDWRAPSQIMYKFKLLGSEKAWSLLTKDNIVDYRNISPGDYTFIVKAIGKSGNWSKEFEYPFIIRWPWWFSWAAWLFYIVAFIFILFIIIRWRVNIIKGQKIILENMVARRTKDLDDALILAEQANNAKSQFITTISHEIRTPLNAIMGFANLANDYVTDSKQLDYLQKIDRSANTMLSLINDILDFSKIEVGKMQLENVPFDIEIVMNSVIILNAQLAREKNLEFVINIDSDIPRMLIGDPLRIGQVITNFCSNAIKFTSSGEVVINIELDKKISETELLLKFVVADTGIGIEKEQIPLLFDEFKQADNSITRKYGGTGLGLSISKLLADLMGGHIWVESELGVGTSFFFDCKVGVKENERLTTKLNADDLKLFNILVCDNNLSALDNIKSILESFSLNVDAVGSGEEVLKQFQKKQYDLLIIDQNLNGVLGTDIILEINNNLENLKMKSIIMSNSEFGTIIIDDYEAGINGKLSKPLLPSVVYEELLAVFGVEKVKVQEWDSQVVKLEQLNNILSNCRVLIVEDNELNRQVITELVGKVSVAYDVAENGVSAIKKASENKYDLIFMDLHMPVKDGFSATKEIREFDSQTPIIAITADFLDDVKDRCDQLSINDIITKPIDPDLLYSKLYKWLSKDENLNKDLLKNKSDIDSEMLKISTLDLNIQSAIRRFGDNKELYFKMLKKFIESNKHIWVELKGLMLLKEFEKAHLTIHTFKGESANIGAEEIHKLSIQLEKMILKKDHINFEKDILILKNKFEKLTSKVQYFFQDEMFVSKDISLSLPELVNELISCLEVKDTKTFDLLDKLNDRDIEKSKLEAINVAINAGNLDDAFILLKGLL